MAQNKNLQKLELTWIGKGDEPKLEPRILIENPEYSYWEGKDKGKPAPWGNNNSYNHSKNNLGNPSNPQNHVPDNMLIHGDNLLALKALEQDYAGKVKCIYIDPPYNTGNAFEHYDDNLEHSIWLNLMNQRIKILHRLLHNEGVFILHLDDQEVFYAKVLCDEIFGRDKFITSIAIKSSTPSGLKTAHRNKTIIKQKDLVLIYKKGNNISITPQYIARDKWDSHYSKFYNRKENKVYDLIDILLKDNVIDKKISVKDLDIHNKKFKKFYVENADNIFQTQPTMPEDIKVKSLKEKDTIIKYIDSEGVENYVLNGRRFAFLRNSLNILDTNETDLGVLLCDFWSDIDFQNTQNEGSNSFPAGKKPEKLINRFLRLFTKEGDLVLDSFLGSGSTAAVAHKLKRKYIGIELGDHAITHCYPRLKNIIDNKDKSGVSEIANWQGGGGFKFYTLAPSLLKKDKFGQWIMSDEYNADMLAAAMAKQEGFKYNPSETQFWKQGNSSEQDFIFTTTQFLTVQQLEAIAEDMQAGESLLICCKAFQTECKNKFPNITIKKIPQLLLDRCEFGKDDYSLNIVNIPGSEQDLNDFEDDQDFYEDEEGNDKETTDKNPTLFE